MEHECANKVHVIVATEKHLGKWSCLLEITFTHKTQVHL